MASRLLRLDVNGRTREVAAEAGATLLDVLRNGLGLTGTKRGCGQGECGACTVLVNGETVDACLYPAARAEGKQVLTIEGLGSPDALHPLQQAFLDRGAVQCGFCTPGVLLAAKALLDENPDPSEPEIRMGISGNLCRCTGYMKMVEAILDAAAVLRGQSSPPAVEAGAGHVGESVPRLEGVSKVLGTALYADDIAIPGMLHAKVLRSPHPHARITMIDFSAALALEGVSAVVTAADIPGRNSYGIIVKDQPFLAEDRVRFVGEAVAAVAAESAEIAERALNLIHVGYEPLPAVFDPVLAMDPDAPVVLGSSNIRLWRKVRRGDTDQAFAAAPVVVKGEFRTPLVEHAYIEPEAGVAVPGSGEITLHCVSQGVHYTRGEIAAMLGWPLTRVRVAQTVVGGGFGGKIDLSVHPFIALLAVQTGRPVKLVYTREESMQASTKRHPFVIQMRLAATEEGLLLAGEARIVGDTGAYASYGHAVLTRAAASAFGPYNVSAVKVDAYMVHTNNPVAGAMRGFGVPQMATAYEQLIDVLAAKVGVSPLEVRRRNIWRPGRATTATGHDLVGSVAALEALERAVAVSGYERDGKR